MEIEIETNYQLSRGQWSWVLVTSHLCPGHMLHHRYHSDRKLVTRNIQIVGRGETRKKRRGAVHLPLSQIAEEEHKSGSASSQCLLSSVHSAVPPPTHCKYILPPPKLVQHQHCLDQTDCDRGTSLLCCDQSGDTRYLHQISTLDIQTGYLHQISRLDIYTRYLHGSQLLVLYQADNIIS